MVDARAEFFADHGLTPDTHFIASTGIEGSTARPDAKVSMDAYAIAGVRPEQLSYLAAPDHLSPTHTYGVTFERATSVAYRDRNHIILSGTASIDPEGNILHPGDMPRQLDRTLENMEALLAKAGATLRTRGVHRVRPWCQRLTPQPAEDAGTLRRRADKVVRPTSADRAG